MAVPALSCSSRNDVPALLCSSRNDVPALLPAAEWLSLLFTRGMRLGLYPRDEVKSFTHGMRLLAVFLHGMSL